MPDIGSLRDGGDDEDRTPLVSVVLPVFNCEEFVAAAVESALSQTGVKFEVVVVDDGSSDGTAEVLARYASDTRLRIVRLPQNLGLTPALNRGVQEARGELIARLDADDLALPGRLAAQVEVFAADPSVVLTACAYDRVLPSGDLVRRAAPPATHGALAMAGWSGNRLCHSAVMFRRSTVLALGGYRVEWYPVEDFDLWLRLLEAGRYRGTSFVGTRYLVNPEGISLQQEQRQLHLVRGRCAEFTTSLLGEEHPLTGSVRQQLRHLDRFRVALHRHLAAAGESADGVDAMAYQLAFETVGAGSPVLRHLRVATAAPGLWRAGRQARSR
jgi:hypothetical protein